jgi:hypothetical protein
METPELLLVLMMLGLAVAFIVAMSKASNSQRRMSAWGKRLARELGADAGSTRADHFTLHVRTDGVHVQLKIGHGTAGSWTYELTTRVPHGLHNALRTATILADGGEIRLEHLPAVLRTATSAPSGGWDSGDRAHRKRIRAAVEATAGNVTAAAHRLGYSRAHLHKLLNKYGIAAAEFRRARL